MLALTMAGVGSASAAVPTSMVVEGFLNSTGGGAAADGVYDVTFAIYNVQSGGSAAWSEGPLKVAVKGGQFTHAMGASKAISAATLDKLTKAWLELKIGADPALPRQALRSVAYAVLANTAKSLACSGCVKGGSIASGTLGADKVGFTFAGAKTKGGPANVALDLQCTGCVGVSELKIDKDLDLGGNALKAKAVVAASISATTFQGDGSKLTGIKTPAGECKVAGEVVKGINPDGTLKCVKAMDPKALPADGIDEISNNLIHNQFQNTDCITKSVPLNDNNPVGVSSELIFGNYGLAQKLDVHIDVSNSDLKTVIVKLWDPNNVEYLLWDKSGAGTKLSGVWPSKTKTLKGDLTKWVNKNPKGKWRIQVIDGKYLNNGNDGAVTKFCVNIQTLSNQKVEVQGDLIVGTDKIARTLHVKGNTILAGSLKVGKDAAKCTAAKDGTLRYDSKYGLQVCQRSLNKSNKISKWLWVVARSSRIMWSGGCSKQGNGGGWRNYCLNATDFNNADDYISISASNGVVTIKTSGYYRINYFAMQHGCATKHQQLLINGSAKHYGYEHNHDHSWHNSYIDYLWPLREGDTFYVRYYANSCNPYGYHSWNGGASHSRTQIEYMGPLSN